MMTQRNRRTRLGRQHQPVPTWTYPTVENPIIGYVACVGDKAVCVGDSCVLAGSPEKMQSYAEELAHATIESARLNILFKRLEFGTPFSFDLQAYERFRPFALELAGVCLPAQPFTDCSPESDQLFCVRWPVRLDLLSSSSPFCPRCGAVSFRKPRT